MHDRRRQPQSHVARLACALALACSLAGVTAGSRNAHAEFQNETLLVSLPDDFKLANQSQKGNARISEFVPAQQSASAWTELISVQIMLGMKGITTEIFESRIVASWRTGCPEAEHHPVGRGIDNGYAFTLWRLSCPLSKTSGKPEHAWFKAIAGRDSFYLVQNAFRATPSREQAIAATSYLAQVKVCDTRLADRPCPSVAPPDQP